MNASTCSITTGTIDPASRSGPSNTTIRSQVVRPTNCTAVSLVNSAPGPWPLTPDP